MIFLYCNIHVLVKLQIKNCLNQASDCQIKPEEPVLKHNNALLAGTKLSSTPHCSPFKVTVVLFAIGHSRKHISKSPKRSKITQTNTKFSSGRPLQLF